MMANEAAFARGYGVPEHLHRHAMENVAEADALLFGPVTYEMMEAEWLRARFTPSTNAVTH